MSFLKAEWRKLALANYSIDPKILEKYLPYGTQLDEWNGNYYVSLVGFMFLNTKVLGIKVPFHVNFEEVNLRFYVKRFEDGAWKRGVVFIKEIVPKKAIPLIANSLYKENYQALPMSHQWEETNEQLKVSYRWKTASQENLFQVTTSLEAENIPIGNEEEFITEHYWGYAKVNENKTNEYEVTHPKWEGYPVTDYKIKVDFGENYGEDFEFLNHLQPTSVMLAEGSKTTVEGKKVLRRKES